MVKVVFGLMVLFLALGGYDSTTRTEVVRLNTLSQDPRFQPPLVNKFPSPDGATRGLTFDGTYLWSADNGDGNSQQGKKIYRLDPTNGSIINAYAPPGVYPNGLTWDGEYLWHSDHGTGMIYKIDTSSMTVIKSFPAPTNLPFDLAWDDQYLYAVRGNENLISKIDTATGNEIETIVCDYNSPNVRPFGLVFLPFNSGQLWTSDGNLGSNYVNEYDFATSSWIDQWPGDPTSYPCGLAYDPVSGYLWMSCWTKDSIYVYDVGTPEVSNERKGRVDGSILTVSPIPCRDNLVVDYLISQPSIVELNLYDLTGKLVSELITHKETPGSHRYLLDIRNLSAGVYFVSLRTDRSLEVKKVMVLK